ncbi:MAG: YjbQ family protein [Legionella sp.]|nr:YjbQ family protein [Legionella sp.]
MKIEQNEIIINTTGRGTQNITQEISKIVSDNEIKTGLCHLFLKHTSASLIICENYDVQVRKDLDNFFARLIPDGDPLFKHVIEGIDDMPAHIRTIITQTEMNIPISQGELALGKWQGIFLYEHRYNPQKRQLLVTIMGL